MNCDICGKEILGQAFRVKVEGAKMLVCRNCQGLGTPYREDIPKERPNLSTVLLRQPATARRPLELPKEMEELEVTENFAELVRIKRTKLGLSQEELAQKVREKLSVIQKIETGKITPNTQLCRQLQHELKVRLLVPRKEIVPPKISPPADVTLGDIVKIKGSSQELPSD